MFICLCWTVTPTGNNIYHIYQYAGLFSYFTSFDVLILLVLYIYSFKKEQQTGKVIVFGMFSAAVAILLIYSGLIWINILKVPSGINLNFLSSIGLLFLVISLVSVIPMGFRKWHINWLRQKPIRKWLLPTTLQNCIIGHIAMKL